MAVSPELPFARGVSQKPIEEKTKTFYNGVVTLGDDPAECYQVKTAPELAHEKLSDDAPTDQSEYLTVSTLITEHLEQSGAYDLLAPKGEELG